MPQWQVQALRRHGRDHVGSVMYNALKVFSATKARDREVLGERVTRWLRSSAADVVDKLVLQSSDREFHCVTIVVFYRVPYRRRR